MIVGSVASSAHGAPRTTQDIDIVVQVRASTLADLLSLLPEDEFYVSVEAAKQALRDRSQFNVIGLATGWKADLIVLKPRPFSMEEFGRRRRLELFGHEVWTASPEDTMIAKLEWSKLSGGSERQRRDVAGILARNRDRLELEYLDGWIHELGLDEEWSAARELAGPG